MKSRSLTAALAVVLALLISPMARGKDSEAAHAAKNKRYNGGPCELTRTENDCFFETTWPSVSLVPLKESTVVAVGEVTCMQSYLSEDRTHVYTEIALHVAEVLKAPSAFALSSEGILVIDRIGGSARSTSGKKVQDNTRIEFQGAPHVGGRYVFFARQIHGGKDLGIVTGYELRGGKVFRLTENGTPGTVVLSKMPGQEDAFSLEQSLLRMIRQQAEKSVEHADLVDTNGRVAHPECGPS